MPKQNKNKIYSLSTEEVFRKFRSGDKGLSEKEAKKRIEECGYNKIERKIRWRWAKLVFNQFNDALVWVLLVAAALAFLFSEMRDVTIILIIVFINAAIGFFQEFKAERILDNIRKLTTDKALIFRDKEKREIDAKLIVPGDVIFVTSGDNVPADGYLIESFDLKVNSMIFTGESKPRKKEAGRIKEKNLVFSDISNMVFMGETIATGEAKFLVTGTGMNTELGRIANLTQEVKEENTPMQKQMRELGRNVSILAVLIGIIVIIAGQYFRMSLYQNFLFALALAVSVVPEGLPAAISVALSLGMKRLLKDNVLAKKLNAVETLGSVSIVCTDKTGTITRNELAVTKAILPDKNIEITGNGYEPKGNFILEDEKINPKEVRNLELLFKIGVLCNDASIIKEKSRYKIIGDPTEGALIVAGRKFHREEKFFYVGERKMGENPFSSERMRMSVIYKNKNITSFVKGSPDVILELSKFIKIENKIRPITAKDKEKIRLSYDQMSKEALRVLAFAYRDLDKISPREYHAEAEKNLVWVGMMGMIDPPRQDVGRAVQECRNLGISVIMITGDYEITAEAIARSVGLIKGKRNSQFIINGKTLNTLSDREIYQRIKKGACIFARISPEQKLRIASIMKKYGEVIAMTGDGVNDAPALKRADIGVAMGIMGTDVSKEAADMILIDDNFSSIVKGIKEGRTIFSNLKKFVHYVFSSNASELFAVLLGVVLQVPAPVSAVQILAIDLGTDVFPSFALGLEPPEPESSSQNKKAINSKKALIDFSGFQRIIYLGIIMATGAVITFLWSMMRGGWHFGEKIAFDSLLYMKSTSATYAVLSMTQMANFLESRSERFSPFKLGFFKNKYAIGALIISVFMLLALLYVPFFQKYLGMRPIDGIDWLMVAIFTLAVFLWEEMRKSEK
ncbi:MAG TPA: cation-transporting P-type ATPase [Candidatus Moranbacteria bacterium]|nr:cation-transporting P-type ATPase [Candidatus Moranbacteria bacterium]